MSPRTTVNLIRPGFELYGEGVELVPRERVVQERARSVETELQSIRVHDQVSVEVDGVLQPLHRGLVGVG